MGYQTIDVRKVTTIIGAEISAHRDAGPALSVQVAGELDRLLGQSLRTASCLVGLLSCQAPRASRDGLRGQAVLTGLECLP
jgi:hypothetical protein